MHTNITCIHYPCLVRYSIQMVGYCIRAHTISIKIGYCIDRLNRSVTCIIQKSHENAKYTISSIQYPNKFKLDNVYNVHYPTWILYHE